MFFKQKNNTYDFLVVGLGNPGIQYEKTRHNAGFMAADALAEKFECTLNKNRHNAIYGDFHIKEKRILLAKPQTFMNLSGKAVSEISAFYKIPTDRIIIIFDDISLDVGKIRLRRKGSAGGHNGMKDIIELMGTEEIMRIKIGVGSKPNPDYDLKDWVLGKFPKSDIKPLSEALENTVKAVEEAILHGIDSAMNKYSK